MLIVSRRLIVRMSADTVFCQVFFSLLTQAFPYNGILEQTQLTSPFLSRCPCHLSLHHLTMSPITSILYFFLVLCYTTHPLYNSRYRIASSEGRHTLPPSIHHPAGLIYKLNILYILWGWLNGFCKFISTSLFDVSFQL